jgi:alkylation response protein AidB-like acyl-CoA dehydrogenase
MERSADEKLFLATAKEFLEKDYPLDRVRHLDDEPAGFERGWWRRAAELGWASLLVPEELGGGSISGRGVCDLALLAEALGAGVAPGPLLATNAVLAGLVEAHGHGPDHTAEIEALAAGESVATWAVYEPGRHWQPDDPGLTATPTADGHRLDGVKDRVESAAEADLLLVTARTPEGPAQFLVPTDAPGVRRSPQWSLDLGRRFGEVHLEGVEVGADALVGAPAGTAAVVERQLQVALVIQCAEVTGGLDRMFEATLRWAFDRFSFGRPIASYQALKHRFADLRTWLEAARAITAAAADAVQDRADDAAELVSAAKGFVGGRAPGMLQDCVQLHGGIGVTWEHDLHLFLRRATVDRSLYGTPSDHHRRLADLAGL